MLVWALVNVVLSLLALAFAAVNKGAPHRLRFHVCFIALLCWLVPWGQVPQVIPNPLSLDLGYVEQKLIKQSAAFTQIPAMGVAPHSVPLANDFTVLNLPLLLLAALLLTGLVLFAWNLLHHQLRLHLLKRGARNGSDYWQAFGIESSVPLLLQSNISGAFSSGIFKPLIWVHDDLVASTELPTLLRHELTHIAQHDNCYLLAITMVEKLCWWNPLVRHLGRKTRDLQELSCDERCHATNADYAVELAALMLSNVGVSNSIAPAPLLLSANIFNKTNLDIQRLKVLQGTYQMKPRHIVSAVATAVLAIVTVGLVTAQPEPEVRGTPAEEFQKNRASMLVEHAKSRSDQSVVMVGSMLSFKFNDAPLPFVLQTLAGATMLPPVAEQPQQPFVRQALAGVPGVEQSRQLRERQVQAVKVVFAMDGHEFKPLFPSKVKVADASAESRLVSVNVENVSYTDAIAKVAEASRCNILNDNDMLVVNSCKSDQ